MNAIEQRLTEYIDRKHRELSEAQSKIDDAMTVMDLLNRGELTDEYRDYFQGLLQSSQSIELNRIVRDILKKQESA